MITARDLRRDYGSRHALDGLTLDVAPGEVVGLLGPNGAGKSTLLAILAGVLEPTSGTAEVGGVKIPTHSRRLGRVVGFVPQGESLYPELTVEENVKFFARLHGASTNKVETLLADVALLHRRADKVGALSGGQRQRVALAASLAHDPKVLLLDEPGTGLDPAARDRLGAIVRKNAAAGRAVLISTHSLEEAKRVADRVVFVLKGKVVETLPASEALRLEAAFRAAEAEG